MSNLKLALLRIACLSSSYEVFFLVCYCLTMPSCPSCSSRGSQKKDKFRGRNRALNKFHLALVCDDWMTPELSHVSVSSFCPQSGQSSQQDQQENHGNSASICHWSRPINIHQPQTTALFIFRNLHIAASSAKTATVPLMDVFLEPFS